MNNKQILDSWNRIKPDSAADERMLSAILARNHSVQAEKGKVYEANKTFNLKRLASIAACFAVLIALVALVGGNSGWFGKTLITDVNGGTLNFYKVDSIGAADLAWLSEWGERIDRPLTDAEKNLLFGDLDVAGWADFRSTDDALMHFEGRTGDTKIILAANGHSVSDTSVEGNEKSSKINNISVTAGYAVTDANSKSIKTIIYFATFEVNGTTVYAELAGDKSESDKLRADFGAILERLTKHPPDSTAVKA